MNASLCYSHCHYLNSDPHQLPPGQPHGPRLVSRASCLIPFWNLASTGLPRESRKPQAHPLTRYLNPLHCSFLPPAAFPKVCSYSFCRIQKMNQLSEESLQRQNKFTKSQGRLRDCSESEGQIQRPQNLKTEAPGTFVFTSSSWNCSCCVIFSLFLNFLQGLLLYSSLSISSAIPKL